MSPRRVRCVALAVFLSCSVASAQDFGLDLTQPDEPKPKLTPPPKPKPKTGEVVVKLAKPLTGVTLSVDDGPEAELTGPVTLPSGNHAVAVGRLGFKTFRQKVVVPRGGKVEVFADLEPESSVLTVQANEEGAEVSVDGGESAAAPLSLALPPGRHEVRIGKRGFFDQTKTVTTALGEDTVVSVDLQAVGTIPTDRPLVATPIPAEASEADSDLMSEGHRGRPRSQPGPAWYKRWYVWTAVAVVVAGAATGAVMATRPAPKFDPSTVCGGPCDATLGGARAW